MCNGGVTVKPKSAAKLRAPEAVLEALTETMKSASPEDKAIMPWVLTVLFKKCAPSKDAHARHRFPVNFVGDPVRVAIYAQLAAVFLVLHNELLHATGSST